MQNDFDYSVLERTAHRPWPMPDEPWLMTQTWHDLAFVHWPVDAQQMRNALPAGLELDVFEGQAWIGIVPFHMTNVAPRGVPAMPACGCQTWRRWCTSPDARTWSPGA